MRGGVLSNLKDGAGEFSVRAVAGCSVASPAVALFGIRRACLEAYLSKAKVTADLGAGQVNMMVARRKNDQAGAHQLAHPVAIPIWFCGWLQASRYRYGGMSSDRLPEGGSTSPDPLYLGLARAHFGFGVAASGFRAATKSVCTGATQRRGDARL